MKYPKYVVKTMETESGWGQTYTRHLTYDIYYRPDKTTYIYVGEFTQKKFAASAARAFNKSRMTPERT
jgi:hypothetical protein